MNLTPTEAKLAATLLRLAAEEFGNHGCNDYSLRKDAKLTAAQAREIVCSLNEWHLADDKLAEPDSLDTDCVMDCMLMSMIADRLDPRKR